MSQITSEKGDSNQCPPPPKKKGGRKKENRKVLKKVPGRDQNPSPSILVEKLLGVFEPASFKRFFVVRSANVTRFCEGHTFRRTRELSLFPESQPKISPFANSTTKQTTKMRALRTIGGTPAKVVSHSLNLLKV